MLAIIQAGTDTIVAYGSINGRDMAGLATVALPEGFDPTKPSHVLVNGQWQINTAPALAAIRRERDAKLLACDWTQLADIPEPTRLLWQPYRQALRDMPENTADPFAPIWPTPPL